MIHAYLYSYMLPPRNYYESETAQWKLALGKAERRERLISRLRLLVAVIAIIGLFTAIEQSAQFYWLLPAVSVIIFILLVRAALQQERQTAVIRARLRIVQDELQALRGDNSAFPAGTEFVDLSHPYSFDLDVFGLRSLYQMLCRCVTLEGKIALANGLRKPALHAAEIRSRQEAIREISMQPEWSCRFRAAGSLIQESENELVLLREWLSAQDNFRNRLLIRISAMILPVLSIVGIGVSIWQEKMHAAFNLLIAVNAILWGTELKRIKEANRLLGRNAAVVSKYAALLEIPAAAGFQSSLLSRIGSNAAASLTQIRAFNRLVGRFDSRNNGMAGSLMNVLFLHDFRSLIQLETWRAQNRDLMQQSLNDLTQFDLVNALGSYAFNHPEYSYPELDAETQTIRAVNLRHPLLPAGNAVGNTFRLGAEERLFLLTGANMTGKSTFIRTIGVGMILGQLGLPLPADSASLPLLCLYTSIRVSDSIQEDVSYFKAELERIRSLFDAIRAGEGRYLILIDEPLRGTNSGDKQQGTQAIIRRLLSEGITGILATHDTGLSGLAQSDNGLRNYHFESQVENGVLQFDFRLKPGPSTSANASLLMQQMGIID
jgi:hypothetical protein